MRKVFQAVTATICNKQFVGDDEKVEGWYDSTAEALRHPPEETTEETGAELVEEQET